MDNNNWEDFWIAYGKEQGKINRKRLKNQFIFGICSGVIVMNIVFWLIS